MKDFLIAADVPLEYYEVEKGRLFKIDFIKNLHHLNDENSEIVIKHYFAAKNAQSWDRSFSSAISFLLPPRKRHVEKLSEILPPQQQQPGFNNLSLESTLDSVPIKIFFTVYWL